MYNYFCSISLIAGIKSLAFAILYTCNTATPSLQKYVGLQKKHHLPARVKNLGVPSERLNQEFKNADLYWQILFANDREDKYIIF